MTLLLWCVIIHTMKGGQDNMKKFATYIFSAISIFSLVYFTVKYYYDNRLVFEENDILGWTILVLIILATLVIGTINNHKISIIQSKNKALVGTINKALERQDSVCDEILETLQNSREIELGVFNRIKNKGD